MNIQVISDLHIDYHESTLDLPPCAEVLVVAGDLSNKMDDGLDFLDSCLPKYDHVVVVLGNHDFFDEKDFEEIEQAYTCWDLSNTNGHVLFDDVLELGDKMIYGGVMWTKYWDDPTQEVLAQRSMPGFRVITHQGGKKITTKDIIELHDTFRVGLKNAQMLYDIDLVISHHAPHPNSIHPDFHTSPLNGSFMEDMRDVLKQRVTWIHGHVHNVFDYTAEDFRGSRVVCNPRGYPVFEIRNGFNPTKVIEI